MPQSKSERLATGRIKHFSVGAVIRRGDKFLLINRALPPFGFAGIDGHINQNEDDPVKALIRKVEEVCGLKVKNHKLFFQEELDWNWCPREAIVHEWYLFVCEVSGELKPNEKEVKSIGWYTVAEIKKLKLGEVWEYWFTKLKMINERDRSENFRENRINLS